MLKRCKVVVSFFLTMPVLTLAQSMSSEYLFEKPVKWIYSTNISNQGAVYVAYGKNMDTIAEWFHQNMPVVTNPKGFDLLEVLSGIWNANYKIFYFNS